MLRPRSRSMEGVPKPAAVRLSILPEIKHRIKTLRRSFAQHSASYARHQRPEAGPRASGPPLLHRQVRYHAFGRLAGHTLWFCWREGRCRCRSRPAPAPCCPHTPSSAPPPAGGASWAHTCSPMRCARLRPAPVGGWPWLRQRRPRPPSSSGQPRPGLQSRRQQISLGRWARNSTGSTRWVLGSVVSGHTRNATASLQLALAPLRLPRFTLAPPACSGTPSPLCGTSLTRSRMALCCWSSRCEHARGGLEGQAARLVSSPSEPAAIH